MLVHIWFGFFAISFATAIYQWLINGHDEIFAALVQSTFDMAGLSVEVAIGLIGVLCLWLGFFRIAEQAGLINILSRGLEPLFLKLMPEIPRGHASRGSITMNIAANMLGLDNAATPMGLKAMQDMQTLNPGKDTASNAQILFLVLNTSSVTLLPITIFMYRAQQGAADPAAVFIPILAVCYVQKINLLNKVVFSYFAGFILLLSALASYLVSQPADQISALSSLLGNLTLFSLIMLFLGYGWWKRVNVYDAFIDGAKEGFDVAIKLIPYLVGMLVAIGVLRTSGVLDGILMGIEYAFTLFGFNTDFIQALPTALMKPLSGSGARAMMLETMSTHGVDSFPATLAAILQGSTETTFYVLAVYFGRVGIKRTRHALPAGLCADATGILASVFICRLMF